MNRVLLLLPLLLIIACSEKQPDLDTQMIEQGLVDILSYDSTILLDLKYSSEDNFLGRDAYGDLDVCYLRPVPAEMLAKAQDSLKARRPDLTLLVYDGARPRSIQREMWALVEGTDQQPYVANPDRGSIHNFGCAVDLTLASNDGVELDMGTGFDFFGDLARPDQEDRFVAEGLLSEGQLANRLLLREVMRSAGWLPIEVEWWHFNAFPVSETKERFKIIE
jgi:D-alanyl-D-alanine dipeptidase